MKTGFPATGPAGRSASAASTPTVDGPIVSRGGGTSGREGERAGGWINTIHAEDNGVAIKNELGADGEVGIGVKELTLENGMQVSGRARAGPPPPESRVSGRVLVALASAMMVLRGGVFAPGAEVKGSRGGMREAGRWRSDRRRRFHGVGPTCRPRETFPRPGFSGVDASGFCVLSELLPCESSDLWCGRRWRAG